MADDDDKVVPFPVVMAGDTPVPDDGITIDGSDGIRISYKVEPFDINDLYRQMELAKARAAAVRLPRLEPAADLKAIISTLMEALHEARGQFNQFDRSGSLKQRYEAFRCQLQEAGFAVAHQTRFGRAAAHRRLGELAESRGDVAGALLHYEFAVRSRRDVGCRRRLERLRAHLEHRAARQQRE